MSALDDAEISRDAAIAFFDIAVACAGFANQEPQVALDKFNEHVWAFATRGGDFTYAQMPEALQRAKALAVLATYRYAKLVGTIAYMTGESTADLIRKSGESVILGELEQGLKDPTV